MLGPVRPALLAFMWLSVFPLFVRESLWLSIVYFDDFLTNSHKSKWPFTEESIENTVVTFAKYFSGEAPAKSPDAPGNAPFDPNLTRILAVHAVEGLAIFATYLIISFVVVMVREWIVQHEVPAELREGADVHVQLDANNAGDNQNLFNILGGQDVNQGVPIEWPPVPEANLAPNANDAQFMPPQRRVRVDDRFRQFLGLRDQDEDQDEDLVEGVNNDLEEPFQAHFENHFRNLHQDPNPDQDQNRHLQEFDRMVLDRAIAAHMRGVDMAMQQAGQPGADPADPGAQPAVQPIQQPIAVPVPQPADDPAVQAAIDDDMDDVGDDLDGILQFIGIRGPLINVFVSFIWIMGATFLVNMVLVTLPFVFGRISFGLTGVALTFLAHLFAHVGNVIADATLLTLDKLFGIAVGSVTETSLEAIFRRPLDLTYFTQFLYYIHSPHPKSFFNGLAYVLVGNFIIIMIFVWYVNSSVRFASSFKGQRAELAIIHLLRHFGDILKVITITGIELVTFPIFCGILLSGALLPLFPNETFYGRLTFTINHPFDSPLLYWFTGTFYMFQLAMFVTMCRDIMRRGVLYFVRDPNEENFHPIREVMERPLVPQLRKIAISAVMYAILICLCIGGVVWALRYIFHVSFLPLTFDFSGFERANAKVEAGSFNALSVFQSLFLYIAVLIAIRFILWNYFNPSRIIRKVWDVVFKRSCAKLRLSSFILNDPKPQERGTVHYGSFAAWFNSAQPDYSKPGTLEDLKTLPRDRALFILDGTFVRAPATDSAAGKKDVKLFIEVDKDDNRVDDKENAPTDLRDYTVVYTPPNFRMRIFGLLCVIWGVGGLVVFSVTGLPVIVGRFLLSFSFTSKQINENNVVAFAVGIIPTLLGIVAVDLRAEIDEYRRVGLQKMFESFNTVQERDKIKKGLFGAAKLAIFIVIYFGVLPLLFLYTVFKFVLEPVQTFFSVSFNNILALQTIWSWTLITLLFLITHVPTAHPNNAISRIVNRIFQNGYLDMDLIFACRAFVYPAFTFLFLHAVPQTLYFMCNKLITMGLNYKFFIVVRDYSYVCAIVSIVLAGATVLLEMFWRRWETNFRDEVYLVTEQLENLDR